MKILVAAKHVIDHNIQVRVRSDGSGVHTENIKMGLNPFDEVAIEAAIRLKEQHIASEIIALSIGGDEALNSLRPSLALGADRAILVKHSSAIEPLYTAEIFKQIALKENINLVLLGRQSIDNESNQVGQILSYKLGWGLANSASEINISSNTNSAEITQEMDDGTQKIKITMPCVITCDLRLNEPRFPSMMNIMQAKRKQIEQLNIEMFNINLDSTFETINIEEPKNRADNKVQILDNVDALISILKSKDII